MLLPHALLYCRRDADTGKGARRQMLVVALVVVLAVVITLWFQAVRSSPETPYADPVRNDDLARGDTPARDPGDAAADVPLAVVGYVPYWAQRSAVADAVRESDLLTVAAPWWYSPTVSGDVVEQHPQYTDTGDDVVRTLRDSGLDVMPTIANHRDGEWDFDVVPELIADGDTRGAHVRNIAGLVEERGFDGIVIDYELLGAGDRDNFTAFITELGTALHANGRQLAVALHAQASDAGSGAHNVAQDYRAIGRAADQVHLMTYDLHYDESDAGPIAPLPWIADVLDYATERIPPDKLLLGIGLFGYDWAEGQTAEDLQLAEVDRRVASNDGEEGWDERARAPWFRYRGDGVARTIWYEDARSVEAKLELVVRYDLAGAFIWRLGGVPEDVWQAARQTLRPEM